MIAGGATPQRCTGAWGLGLKRTEYFCGWCSVGHNTSKDFWLLYVLPNVSPHGRSRCATNPSRAQAVCPSHPYPVSISDVSRRRQDSIL
jgi:hypothetical protein